MKITELVKLPDIASLFNLLMGMLAIIYSINLQFKIAAIFLLIAVFFDFLDGKLARLTKREGEFGIHLDSLADLVSFGIAPVIFAFSLGLKSAIALIIAAFFVFSGALRLARFNLMKLAEKEKMNYYLGIPITINGILFPLLYFINLPINYYIIAFALMAILMISPIKIKKVI